MIEGWGNGSKEEEKNGGGVGGGGGSVQQPPPQSQPQSFVRQSQTQAASQKVSGSVYFEIECSILYNIYQLYH